MKTYKYHIKAAEYFDFEVEASSIVEADKAASLAFQEWGEGGGGGNVRKGDGFHHILFDDNYDLVDENDN